MSTPAAAVAVVAGVTPLDVDVVQRMRHSSSTSAASASTTDRRRCVPVPPPSPSSASRRQRRRRRVRQHSSDQQLHVPPPVDLAATPRARPATTSDVTASTANAQQLSSATTTNDDDVARRRLNAAAAAAREGPVTDSVVVQRHRSEQHDVTPPVTPPRRQRSVTPLNSLYSTSSGLTPSSTVTPSSTTARQNSRLLSSQMSPDATARHKSYDDVRLSKHADDADSVDIDKYFKTAPAIRPCRRRRRPVTEDDATAGERQDVDRRPASSGEDGADVAASKRLTMPSVIHYDVPTAPASAGQQAGHRQLPSRPAAADRPLSAAYTLSDGVRRRLVPADTAHPAPQPPPSPAVSVVQLSSEMAEPPRRYRLEPVAASSAGGSMMNVPDPSETAAVWPREDVAMLSELRRDEIRRQKERDRQQALVLRFGDIKVTIHNI